MPFSIKNINYKRIAWHVLFWVVISVFYDAVSSFVSDRPFFGTLIHDLKFFFPSDLIGVYFTLYILIPKLLFEKKYFTFFILSILFVGLLILIITLPLQYYGLYIEFKPDFLREGKPFPSFYDYVSHNFLIAVTIKLMIIGIASAIKISKNWIISMQKQQNLMKEKLEIDLQLRESELRFLKSQINPHFLFNALNNLYSLTLEKSDKAPEVVLKISSILDYVLYECNVPKIDLNREISNIHDYIVLQKIRYGEDTDIRIQVNGETQHSKIAPLLILPLVENAFKHGLDRNVGKGFIDITIDVDDENEFKAVIKNSLKGEKNHNKEGIGILNLKKRLELQYQGKYEFDLKINDESCITMLKLHLN
jgi:two-component system LytT family sensor kinase